MTDAPRSGSSGPKQYVVPTLLAVLILGVAGLFLFAMFCVPGLIPAVKGTNESAAIGALRTLSNSQSIYRERDIAQRGNVEYAPDLVTLNRHVRIDGDAPHQKLSSGTKQGYLFRIEGAGQFSWSATAVPAEPGKTGDRAFFVDESGVIRYTTTGYPTSLDTAIGG